PGPRPGEPLALRGRAARGNDRSVGARGPYGLALDDRARGTPAQVPVAGARRLAPGGRHPLAHGAAHPRGPRLVRARRVARAGATAAASIDPGPQVKATLTRRGPSGPAGKGCHD